MPQKIKQTQDISLGNNLRKLRNAAYLTQEQVIAQLQLLNFSISRSAYSQIEAGTYNIRISELIAADKDETKRRSEWQTNERWAWFIGENCG